MNIKTNASAQTVLVSVIAFIGNAGEIDPQTRFWATLGCAGVMMALSIFAQYRNPNGSNCRAAYDPQPKPRR